MSSVAPLAHGVLGMTDVEGSDAGPSRPIADRSPSSQRVARTWDAPSVFEEELLSGGNTTVVVRVGDTVRRPVGPWTPAVHDLLGHLSRVGFAGSPRALGVDESQREILEFVPGEVGTLLPSEPLPEWFRTPEACWAIGRWIRQFQS